LGWRRAAVVRSAALALQALLLLLLRHDDGARRCRLV
jgi:hypothetical protein